MKKKYQIFDTPWHIPHQYDMINALSNECDFYFCLNVKRQWDYNLRPIPKNLKFVAYYEEGKYDFAILHIDQAIINSNQKRVIYDQFNEVITDIPKIVVNHGSPVFHGDIVDSDQSLNYMEFQKKHINVVKEAVGNNIMVVNSHTAATSRGWGWGVPIVHGINPDDWLDLRKEPRVFTALSPRGFDRYYNRQCTFDVADILDKEYGYILCYANLNVETNKSPQDYKEFLGKSLLYLDTSYHTPMNRARTEAFLSGCCVIQVEGAHDLERWAKHGENIVLVPNKPEEIARTVTDFLENRYAEAIKIGQKGKEMAKKQFNPERYRNDWLNLFKQLKTY
ncbi:MAG TPA: glycosyltransferase [Bacteroidales bacterium]